MKSLISIVLLSIPLLAHADTSGTLHIDIAPRRNLYKRQETVTNLPEAQLPNNEFFLGYYANFTVGTPPQSVVLHVDTGSSDVWVLAAGAKLTPAITDFPGTPGGSCKLLYFRGCILNFLNIPTDQMPS
jgi:hypothetical protein